MRDSAHRAVAIVGLGAILPDAPDVATYWKNLCEGHYSIGDVPAGRWNPALYYDADRKAPDKTYSKIGGFVRDYAWQPLQWRLPIPPKVADAMDRTQIWSIAASRQAIADFGRELPKERTAVIFGNAMAGDQHYLTAVRIFFPEYAAALEQSGGFQALPAEVRQAIIEEMHAGLDGRLPRITEDTMPGELANIIAGRVASVFDLHGPNFVVDAACASAMGAITAAIEGLDEEDYDLVITGGIDANMSASSYVKFSKIGALSGTGTRPYAAGADGFVMGEGAAVFILKRLADAERDGDRIYAVIRSTGGSSDGKGKGITAPNPIGQKLAVERAWQSAGLRPTSATLIEGHGTSTSVGDRVELQCLSEIFGELAPDLPPGSIALGSVKSNIGHLKGAAGAAGLLKTVLSLHHEQIPASLNFGPPNESFDFEKSPFFVNTELRPWENGEVRSAGVSAFGFGGTNFHAVLEEHVPGRLMRERRSHVALATAPDAPTAEKTARPVPAPPRGALVLGAPSVEALSEQLRAVTAEAKADRLPLPAPPSTEVLRSAERLALDFEDAADLVAKAQKTLEALELNQPARWRALRARGVFRGTGAAAKTAFLFTGQGSQYLGMLGELRHSQPIVAETFREADRVMTPLIGQPLTELLFGLESSSGDEAAQEAAEQRLRQTEVTQPAILTVDVALTRLLAGYGLEPDMVMGHSLGEYGALVAAGCLDFEQALLAVSSRGREMASVSVDDNGLMAAVNAPLAEIEKVLAGLDGYAVVANINSHKQAVIGGETEAVQEAVALFTAAGHKAPLLPVSHAFHTRIVAPASKPLGRMLRTLDLRPPRLPLVGNVDGDFYPMGDAESVLPGMLDRLERQIASPVQFVKGLETLYREGARVFVEVGPKRALQSFVESVLGHSEGVLALYTNHPKTGDTGSFNQALCGLWAAGCGVEAVEAVEAAAGSPLMSAPPAEIRPTEPTPAFVATTPMPAPPTQSAPRPSVESAMGPANTVPLDADRERELGRIFAEFLDRGLAVYGGRRAAGGRGDQEPVVITGAGLGLPGGRTIFDDRNVGRILRGEQMIDAIPSRFRQAMVSKHITRLVKSDRGGPRFETIDSAHDVIKLAARAGSLDLVEEFGFPADRLPALDHVTQLAIGAGLDALRDAGIPLVMHYKTTTKGTFLPERWGLPEALRDDTGIIFASAFPGYDSFADYLEGHHRDLARHERLRELETLRDRGRAEQASQTLVQELERRIAELQKQIEDEPYVFDRRFLFRALSMGHSQFAELIGARGPNTQINSACASTTQAAALAEDWIRAGRCRRVVIISADDVTSDRLLEWIASGFLASGAAATDDVVEDAALPFDRRRHGMILGMGAAAMVVEEATAARERGLRPIVQVLSTVTANSAFHGSRLDVHHIREVMEKLVHQAETCWGVRRHEMAAQTLFVSHETYTPARGGSAQAEVDALRHVFGASADRLVMANTKGFTGHPMAVGIEDVVAIKALETGLVPPVANFKEVDPDLGELNLSRGGLYPVRYALRLGAGFGSQISLSLLRRVENPDGRRRTPEQLGYAYRVDDEAQWHSWLVAVGGHPAPKVEIDHRVLRLQDQGPPNRPTAASPGEVVSVAGPTASAQTGSTPTTATPTTAAPTAPAAPALATPAPAEPGAMPTTGDAVQEKVLDIVSAQTGYPKDMLDPELDMEADLGIDTVKQAETFAAIRAEWDIPRDDDLQLRDFPTLAHAAQFVYDRRPDLRPDAPPPPTTVSDPQPPSGAGAGLAPTGGSTQPSQESDPAPAAAGDDAADDAGDDAVQAKVLAIVAEQTGYPEDMLELDLDMEADLGIDTVKQAETFAAIRAEWDIPRDDDLQLREFPTLAHTVQFVYDRRPDLGAGGEPAPTAPETSSPAAGVGADLPPAHGESPPSHGPGVDAPAGDLEAAAKVPRRRPVPVLRPPLALCLGTGVSLDEGARVLLLPDDGGVGKALAGRLEKRGVTVLGFDGVPSVAELLAQLDAWLDDGPIDGVYHLSALDQEGELDQLEEDAWRAAVHRRVTLLYTTMKRLLDGAAEGGGPFLVASTRLGGQHGYDGEGATAPLGGAAGGFAKAYGRERPRALVKVVDFPPSRKTAALADLLIDETLADPGAVEIGYGPEGSRCTVAIDIEPLPEDGEPAVALGPETVFVITGAAGSIVSAIVRDLATAAGGGVFHLLDLASAPDPGDDDLHRFTDDLDGLKRDVYTRLKAAGERATPARVEQHVAGVERRRAALDAMRQIERAGGRAHYHQLDLRDGAAVAAAIEQVRGYHGHIDVLMHAGGLEISHFLGDKPADEFDLVFGVKADGWYHLMRACRGLEIGATVVFSSIAGRFGNAGQTDYSAANDFLCKATSHLRSARPGTFGLAIDWTAWGEIGMASRGSIPAMMELAGIGMLDPRAGAAIVRQELTAGDGDGNNGRELVIATELGAMLDERHPTGGLDPEAVGKGQGPVCGRALSMGVLSGLVVETELDPAEQPFLDDHRIDGMPVLPGVMGMEAFAETARLLFPDRHVAAVEDASFDAPFKLYRDATRTVRVEARFRHDGGDVVADCRLLGARTLHGRQEPQVTVHFTGRVRLTATAPAEETLELELEQDGRPGIDAEAIYRLYFHGPAYRVVDSAWRRDDLIVGRLPQDLPPNHRPDALPLFAAPRLVELCFQTAGLGEMGKTGAMGLPQKVGRITLGPGAGEATGSLHAVVDTAVDGAGTRARVVATDGRVILTLEGYQTVALPGEVDTETVELLQEVFA